ncbi:MAG: ATP-binding cassette domain-containing protein [Gammaproteobacteria bacterium]|nr:MAG: ATP-binding cassette domain-containing protein [Gammaproteobacteria bacterium]
MNEILVETRDLSRRYGDHIAVNHIEFSISKGEVLGFLGPNGAGKTTTMQMITGNLAPTTGTIRIAGHDLLDEPRAAKNEIGYLPENPPLYRDMTVDEYLDYCAGLNRIPGKQRKDAREQTKQKCGLTDSGDRLIGNLSKGYQQRVGLAQAIIHNPAVIILDEPTVGLDPIQIREIRALIRELGKNHGIILCSHILPEVQAICNRVQIINHGELVLSEATNNLAKHMQSASLTAAFREPADEAALAQLPGVTRVQMMDERRAHIFYEGDQDPTDAVVCLAMDKHWGLSELTPGQVSLEEIFVQLTLSDDDKETGA